MSNDSFDLDFLNEKDIDTTYEVATEIVDAIKSKEINPSDDMDFTIGDEAFTTKVSNILLALILVPVRFALDRKIVKDDIDIKVDTTSINKIIKDYFDNTIIEFRFDDKDKDVNLLSKYITKVISFNAKISWDINLSHGNSANIYDMIKLMGRNKKVKEILFHTSDENNQFSDIEDSVSKKNQELVDILLTDKDTCYRNLLPSVSLKQFQQVFTNISLKPDLDGIVIERPINTSFFRGMRGSTDFFINAIGARKALVVNASQVRNAGYLSRKLSLLNIATDVDRTVEDCGTTDYLEIDVTTKDIAKRFTNRFYKLKYTDKKLLEVRKDTDKLVGKKILFRSPSKCRLESGNVCKTCYGHLANINKFHIGLVIALVVGNQIIQRLLSSKHLLQVSTERIELPEELKEFFYVDKNILIANKDIKLTILEYSDDEDAYTPSVSRFSVLTEDMDDPVEFSGLEIDIFDDIIKENFDDENSVILSQSEEAFKFTVENNEISAPLKKLLSLLESEKELNDKGTIENLVLSVIDLLNQSGIRVSASGIEVIIKGLTRDVNNILENPKDFNNIQFLRLTNAIVNSKSLAVSLAFERLKQQIETTAFNKNGSSVIDGAF